MYKVKLISSVKEVVEVQVEAKYCFVDGNNNLVFTDQRWALDRPIAMFNAGRWVHVRRFNG